MKRLLIILFSGILLIPVLVLCLVSKKQRIKYWYAFNDRTKTYPSLPDNKIDQLFSLCVNFLLLVGKHHLACPYPYLHSPEHRASV